MAAVTPKQLIIMAAWAIEEIEISICSRSFSVVSSVSTCYQKVAPAHSSSSSLSSLECEGFLILLRKL